MRFRRASFIPTRAAPDIIYICSTSSDDCIALACPGCGRMHHMPFDRAWKWNNDTRTLKPSVNCRRCPAHYFITNGEIVHV